MKLVHAPLRDENRIIRGRYWCRIMVQRDARAYAMHRYAPAYELRVVGFRPCLEVR
jgi:hypothetical protein